MELLAAVEVFNEYGGYQITISQLIKGFARKTNRTEEEAREFMKKHLPTWIILILGNRILPG